MDGISEREGDVVTEGNVGKGGVIWKYFERKEKDNVLHGFCLTCQMEYKIEKGTTSSLWYHLNSEHPALHAEAMKLKNKRNSSLERPAKRPRAVIDGQRKKEIDNSLTKMVAMDLLPFSFVGGRGFKQFVDELCPEYQPPHRTQVSRVLMPKLYEEVKSEMTRSIQEDIDQGINCLSLTSDGWTSRAGNSYLSLTAHYLTTDFTMKNYTLCMRQIESHRGEDIGDAWVDMIHEWPLGELNTVPIYIATDNARNMSSAVESTGWNHVHCFAHTLNLALKDSKSDELSVLLAKARRIVTFFNHSNAAANQLEQAQKKARVPANEILRLKQMVDTRWNSEFEMLERLLKLRPYVVQVLSSTTQLSVTLTGPEWQSIEEVVEVLRGLYQATVISCSKTYPTLSMVIPLVAGIKHQLQSKIKKFNAKTIAYTLATSLLENIGTRFTQFDNDIEPVATFLDPRYRSFFIKREDLESMEKRLLEEIEAGTASPQGSQSSYLSQHSIQSNKDRQDFWAFMVPDGSQRQTSNQQQSYELKNEIKSYAEGVPIDPNNCPLEWWRKNRDKFPNLAILAQKYLSIPCTSTDSERLFSTGGDVINEKRTNLLPDNAEKLVFLAKNL